MNIVDKISRESKILVDSTKDSVVNNVVAAARTNLIDLNQDQLTKLVSVLGSSIDEGYQRALPTYQKTITKLVDHEISSQNSLKNKK